MEDSQYHVKLHDDLQELKQKIKDAIVEFENNSLLDVTGITITRITNVELNSSNIQIKFEG